MGTPERRNIVIYQAADFSAVFPFPEASTTQIGVAEVRLWPAGPRLAEFDVAIDVDEETVTISLTAEQTLNIARNGVYDVRIQGDGSFLVGYGTAILRPLVATGTPPGWSVAGYGEGVYGDGIYGI